MQSLLFFQDKFSCQPWSTKMPKLAQPNLNFIAPEVQSEKKCSSVSDIFSLGMTICCVYNRGQPLINAEYNTQIYNRQLDLVIFSLYTIDERTFISLAGTALL